MRHLLFLFVAVLLAPVARADDCPVFHSQWGVDGYGPGELKQPARVRVTPRGTLLVANHDSPSPIQEFSLDGQFIRAIGSEGNGPGQYTGTFGMAVAQDGSLWITDLGGSRVEHFDAAGNFVAVWGTLGNGDGQFVQPAGLAIAPDGTIYVSDLFNDRIQRFAPDGTYLANVGACHLFCGHGPFDMVVDQAGFLYVIGFNNRVEKYAPTGELAASWAASGFGIALGSDGTILIADTESYRIQKFTADGQFLCSWGSYGEGQDQFLSPFGVAAGPDGKVFVADEIQTKIKIFELGSVPTEVTTLGRLKARYR